MLLQAITINREKIASLHSNIAELKAMIADQKNAVALVPQGSQPDRVIKITDEKLKELGTHRRRLSTYYPRCFKKGSALKTRLDNTSKVLESIDFVLPYESDTHKLEILKSRKNELIKLLSELKSKANLHIQRG